MDSDDEREFQELCRREKLAMDERIKKISRDRMEERASSTLRHALPSVALEDITRQVQKNPASSATNDLAPFETPERAKGAIGQASPESFVDKSSLNTGKLGELPRRVSPIGADGSTSSGKDGQSSDASNTRSPEKRAAKAKNGIENAWGFVPGWCPLPSASTYTLLEAIRLVARAKYTPNDALVLANRNFLARLKVDPKKYGTSRELLPRDYGKIVESNMNVDSSVKVTDAEAAGYGFRIDSHGLLVDRPTLGLDISVAPMKSSSTPILAQGFTAATKSASREHSISTAMDISSDNSSSDEPLAVSTTKKQMNSTRRTDESRMKQTSVSAPQASMRIPKRPIASGSTPTTKPPKSLRKTEDLQIGTATGSSSSTAQTTYDFAERLELPTWYRGARGDMSNRGLIVNLQKIKGDISNVLSNRGTATLLSEDLDKIRSQLHHFEYLQGINDGIMKKSGLLETSRGLPELFLPRLDGFAFPFDIIADAKSLWRKWARGDFDPDIMRGIKHKTKPDGKKGGNSVDDEYPHKLGWKYFGNGDLVPGQWWPLQIAALRDGAHGETQAGISGVKDKGAYSVVVSGKYDDVDEGEVMWYFGTEGSNGQMTDATKMMLKNVKKPDRPVRVLRSSKLPDDNPYRPSLGFRFDGSYDVIQAELVDEEKAHYRFRLQRQPNQDPIRYQGLGARPTPQDISAYRKHKLLSN